MGKLSGKDLISIHNLSREDIDMIFTLAAELKHKLKNNQPHHYLQDKSLAMIFEKPSTRTRVSFEIGMQQLGGYATNLQQQDIQIGERESLPDVARTLSRFVNGILVRTFAHQKLIDLAKYASVPVINGLSDLLHPCQALADFFTIKEKKAHDGPQGLKGLKMAYLGDGNNVCHSLMFAAAKLGVNLTMATPKGYEPDEVITKTAFEDARSYGAEFNILNDPVVAAQNADVIYTDVWTSMGQEKESQKRRKIFAPFQVNSDLLKLAKPDCIVMHCLPAHRGEEITDEVIDGPHSVVFDQAENRLHVQKAILVSLLGG
ncbi:MAG: ornithine carbamoyltransferase [Candidatus Margulisiibacteriota bacterium]|nr:ornithine carbamoyltransferase [Candidatus Margulisiibacteriota bacterium]